MDDKIKIIAYYDPAGYGSINETLKDAKKYDKSITYDDVNKWKASQAFGQKATPRGMNSFITDAPHEEYQMDLLFLLTSQVLLKMLYLWLIYSLNMRLAFRVLTSI